MIRSFLILAALLFAVPALAQTYPPLTGRVVDQAEILAPEQEAALTQKLEALERASSRQLVVLTVPNLAGQTIEDYGVGLGRAWRIGQSGANNGVVLIVAVEDRKVRIEVGYGLEGILTDALSSQIIRNDITPRFREGDYPGGIEAGADAIIAQLQAPPEAAEQRVRAAADTHRSRRGSGSILTLIFWIVILVVIIIASIVRRGVRGRRFGGRRGRRSPVILWGPGLGGGGWGGGSWGGGGGGSSWGGGGGGGFSGGGGSFGGGGASGGW